MYRLDREDSQWPCKFIPGSTVEVFADEDKQFTGLLFQDKTMKATYAAYPEVLFVDATYKLNNLRMPLYIFLTVDGNGQSEIVGLFITSLETEAAITQMVQAFKSSNPCWDSTRMVMTDKDLIERNVFRKEFPNYLFASSTHCEAWRACEKLKIKIGEREQALELVQKLAYSKSHAQYTDNYQSLLQSGLHSVIKYYNTNWHPIRHEWVECYKDLNFTLGESTNNRLESINAKIKSVCSRHVNLSTFFNQFFSVLSCLRNERDHATIMALAKRRVIDAPENSPQWQYASLVTPYALNFILRQLSVCKNVKLAAIDNTTYTAAHLEGNLTNWHLMPVQILEDTISSLQAQFCL